jgi:hypothetical protein
VQQKQITSTSTAVELIINKKKPLTIDHYQNRRRKRPDGWMEK